MVEPPEASEGPLSISVIIPCRDDSGTLGEQLEAVARQSWPGPWEVIVADNGSTDGSRDLAEAFRSRLGRLRVIDASARRGPAHARNRGAEEAAGEALLFTDADDRVGDGWLAAMGAALRGHPFVAARYDAEALNPPAVVRSRTNPQRESLIPYDYPPFLPHAGGSSLGVRRKVHEAVGGFDESLPALEDTDYCWRIQLRGTELVFVPEAVVHIRYRERPGGLFHQSCRFGTYNVLMYRRYRPRGMPRLPWHAGIARWVKLLLTTPKLLVPRTRAAWLGQLGWRLGRLRGCLRYRVLAP
jgi:cellulose synthase/poly-beta-1,6-N-acetylglucosamine synthase-like glycosyltransferase